MLAPHRPGLLGGQLGCGNFVVSRLHRRMIFDLLNYILHSHAKCSEFPIDALIIPGRARNHSERKARKMRDVFPV